MVVSKRSQKTSTIWTKVFEMTEGGKTDDEVAPLAVEDDSSSPDAQLCVIGPDDWPRYVVARITRLWAATMLTCGLIPTLENEAAAYEIGGHGEYRSRIRSLRRRVLIRDHHGHGVVPRGYLVNYLRYDEPASDDALVDNCFVLLDDVVAVAVSLGWKPDDNLLAGLANSSGDGSIEEAPTQPPKPGPAKKWKESHWQMLYAFFALHNKQDQHSKLLAAKQDKEFVTEIVNALAFKFDDRSIDEVTVKTHLKDLATYLNAAVARSPDRKS